MNKYRWALLILLLVVLGWSFCPCNVETFGAGKQCTEDTTYMTDCGKEATIKCVDGYYMCGLSKDCKSNNTCPGTLVCGPGGMCQDP